MKEFLNDDVGMIKAELTKNLPEFDHILTYWTANQVTVGKVLSPRALNAFFKVLREEPVVDYNTCVDRVLQISPCYTLTNHSDKPPKEMPTFGFMERTERYALDLEGEQMLQQMNIEDNMGDYHFDGEDI